MSPNDYELVRVYTKETGAMSSSAWSEMYRAFQYKVNTADLTGRENQVCQVIAFLNVGVTNPDVSFAVSALYILTK